MIKVLPSSNPEKEENLVNYVRDMVDLGVEYLHCDTMDGVCGENKCLSFETLKNVRNSTNILLDVHLMVKNPIKVIKDYISLKPSIITVHYEACQEKLKDTLKLIKSHGAKCGAVINPDTEVSKIADVIEECDMILLMSVFPGFGGQKFIPEVLPKIEQVAKLVNSIGKEIDIE